MKDAVLTIICYASSLWLGTHIILWSTGNLTNWSEGERFITLCVLGGICWLAWATKRDRSKIAKRREEQND